MIKIILSVVAALLALSGIIAFIYYLRKEERKNNIVTTQEALLQWEDIKCIRCGKYTEQGYIFGGKGIIWTPRQNRKQNMFSSAGSLLENTFSMRMPTPLNMAWYCRNCKLIVIDNSKMIRFKKP